MRIFESVQRLISKHARTVHLMSFAETRQQLPLYLDAMSADSSVNGRCVACEESDSIMVTPLSGNLGKVE